MTTRRRFISILAGCAGLGPLSAARAAIDPAVSVWRGISMGALASVRIAHPDRAKAQALIGTCVREVQRLEAIFSLYRPDSALCRLNAAGQLRDPPQDLIELLSFALSLSQRSGGAFDPTVQPLYRLYADHYAAPGADASGPAPAAIARVLRSVDFTAVELRADRIRLGRPGMALTLNAVAQGYITDRVADRLREAGFDDVLVDLGEARALGRRPDGSAWQAAIADPDQPARTLLALPLGDAPGAFAALATSSGRGTCFGPDARIHHLLDARTGRSANHWRSVSVAAARATLADGFSTTLALLPPTRGAELLALEPSVRAWFVNDAGRIEAAGMNKPGSTHPPVGR